MDKVFSSSFYHNRYVDSSTWDWLLTWEIEHFISHHSLTNSCKREYLCTCLYLFGWVHNMLYALPFSPLATLPPQNPHAPRDSEITQGIHRRMPEQHTSRVNGVTSGNLPGPETRTERPQMTLPINASEFTQVLQQLEMLKHQSSADQQQLSMSFWFPLYP